LPGVKNKRGKNRSGGRKGGGFSKKTKPNQAMTKKTTCRRISGGESFVLKKGVKSCGAREKKQKKEVALDLEARGEGRRKQTCHR